jgi:hypothetical protein
MRGKLKVIMMGGGARGTEESGGVAVLEPIVMR